MKPLRKYHYSQFSYDAEFGLSQSGGHSMNLYGGKKKMAANFKKYFEVGFRSFDIAVSTMINPINN